MVNKYFNDSKPDWNMADEFCKRLNQRLDEAQQARINGELLKWFRTLRAVFNQVHFKVKEAGHEEAEKNLIATFEEIKSIFLSSTRLNTTQQQGAATIVEFQLDELERQLNDLLYEYGLVFGKVEYKTIRELIREDY